MNLYFLLFCFFCSGMTSLVYEVIWTRYLTSVFGSSGYSISTVLTAFMAGLALGSFWAAKWQKKLSSISSLFLYIIFEIAIGLFALISPELFGLLKKLSLVLLPDGSYLDASTGLWAKFALSFSLLIVPTFLMGATFPLLSQYFVENTRKVKQSVGGLYAWNTFGAVLGTFLAGFVLLHTVGVNNSVRLAALINLAIGVSLWFLNKESLKTPTKEEEKGLVEPVRDKKDKRVSKVKKKKVSEPGPPPLVVPRELANLILGLFAVSGFLALGYEVLWTRLLTQVLGSSTYAFSLILICFLAGIAGGSWIISKFARDEWMTPTFFGWLITGIGLLAYLLLPLMSMLPEMMLAAFKWFPDSFVKITLYQFLLVSGIILPATLLMGAAMPVVISLVKSVGTEVSDCVGTAYSYNTVGAIFGSFFTGFLFIPYLGPLISLKMAITANLLMGTGFLFYLKNSGTGSAPKKSTSYFSFLPLLLLIPLAGQTWPKGALDVCVSIYGPEIAAKKEKTTIGNQLFHAEGINASVSIRKAYDHITLHINGKTDASNGQDMATQVLLGLLPHLAAPEKEKVLVIGLGSGVTARVLAESKPERTVWAAEIEPAVVEASKFFSKENGSLHTKGNVRFVVNDARNFLLNSGTRFGLITSEPSNPWMIGIANLFTEEFYRLVRQNLDEDGAFVQWFHLYGMDSENFKMVLKTLAKVFPSIQLWESGFGDMLFVCSEKPVRWDFSPLRKMEQDDPESYKELKKNLFLNNPDDLWAYFNGAFPARVFDFPGVQVNSDQWPLLEFRAPLSLYKNTLPQNRQFAQDLFKNFAQQEEVGFPGMTNEDCGMGSRESKSKGCLMQGIIRTKTLKQLSYQQVDEAESLLDSYPDEWTELDSPRARVALLKGKYSEAVSLLNKYIDESGNHWEELLMLAEAALGDQDLPLAMRCLEALMEGRDQLSDMQIERLSTIWQGVGEVDRAFELLKARTAKTPNYRLYFQMGRLMATQSDFDAAERLLRKSLEINPYSGSTILILGNVLWRQGRKEEARAYYETYQEKWEGSEKIARRLESIK